MSLATLDRRVVPVIETVVTEWGGRLIPSRSSSAASPSEHSCHGPQRKRPGRSGRKASVSAELVERIRAERAQGKTLADIARLNVEGIRPAQDGRQRQFACATAERQHRSNRNCVTESAASAAYSGAVDSCPACGNDLPGEFPFCPFCGAQVSAAVVERRKLATLLFCDMSGSTAMGERVDAETVQELMLLVLPGDAGARRASRRDGGEVHR